MLQFLNFNNSVTEKKAKKHDGLLKLGNDPEFYITYLNEIMSQLEIFCNSNGR